MQIENVTHQDLDRLGRLQPEGWPDIRTAFSQYIRYSFCEPVKVLLDDRMIGLGCAIFFRNTAWLAHIIVDEDYRGKGIGTGIVNYLLYKVRSKGIHTTLLIATELGESIYKRAGFRVISDYLFFKREAPWKEMPESSLVTKYSSAVYDQLLMMDREISGEDRQVLITEYLKDSYVFVEDKKLKGYYLPGLGEGPIISVDPLAGIALMSLKYANADTAVLPAENRIGTEFLLKTGFVQTGSIRRRMQLGLDIPWQPGAYYSRIGGNFG